MYHHETTFRVRYAETDRMGYVYYGRYAEFFEVGRVEALRALGFPYRALEDRGVLLPVHDLNVKYHKPLPGVRMVFRYELRGSAGSLLTEGGTTLVFVDKASGRPRHAPQELLAALAPFFS
jgi:acyl-CoA thioester hydrolase